MAASSNANADANKRTQEELARQRSLQNEAQISARQSLSQSTPAAARQDLAAGTSNRERAYADIASRGMWDYQSPLQESRTVAAGSKLSNAAAAQTQAANAAYPDWLLAQMIRNAQANLGTQTRGFISRDSAGVLPYELLGAVAGQQNLAGLGGLAGSLGPLVGASGGMFGGSPSASAPGANDAAMQAARGGNAWQQIATEYPWGTGYVPSHASLTRPIPSYPF